MAAAPCPDPPVGPELERRLAAHRQRSGWGVCGADCRFSVGRRAWSMCRDPAGVVACGAGVSHYARRHFDVLLTLCSCPWHSRDSPCGCARMMLSTYGLGSCACSWSPGSVALSLNPLGDVATGPHTLFDFDPQRLRARAVDGIVRNPCSSGSQSNRILPSCRNGGLGAPWTVSRARDGACGSPHRRR